MLCIGYCATFQISVVHYIALHSIAVQYISVHCSGLQFGVVHCITQHYSSLLMCVGFLDSQRMLLHDLYETKMCNSMLFPESDEDIWKHEDVQISVSPLGVHISKGDSKGKIIQMALIQ